MRFLLDVNVGSTIAAALRAAGHDVVRAAQSDPRAEDPDVLARAVGEDRVLVTYDRDFGELVYYRSAGLPPAIIYIRYEPDDISALVERFMPLLDFERLRGHMTVLDKQRTRRTPFPIGSNDNA